MKSTAPADRPPVPSLFAPPCDGHPRQLCIGPALSGSFCAMSEPRSVLDYRAPAPRLPVAENPWLRMTQSLGSVAGAAIGLVVVLAIFSIWRPETFLSSKNFLN